MPRINKEQLVELENCAASCNSLIGSCSQLTEACKSNSSLNCAQLYNQVEQNAKSLIKICNNLVDSYQKNSPNNKDLVEAATDVIKRAEDLIENIRLNSENVDAMASQMVQSSDNCYEVCNRCIKNYN